MRGLVAVWSVSLILVPGTRAEAAFLQCQADLKQPSCTAAVSPLDPTKPLHIGATCAECTGGGSDVKCTPGEKATSATLAVETLAGQVVAGTFSVVGTCEFGMQLLKFGGTLAGGTSYRVVITVAGIPKTELLQFTTLGSPPPPLKDGGTIKKDSTSSGDTGGKPGPTGDGTKPATGDGAKPAGDGRGGTGDGSGPGGGPGGGSEGGCGCAVVDGESAASALLLLALLGLAALQPAMRKRR